MWSQYDEDLSKNDFFIEIRLHHSDILQKAAEEQWIICVPRKGSLATQKLTTDIVLDHILISNVENSIIYNTLSKKEVRMENHQLKLEKGSIFYDDIDVLFEETHYVSPTKKYRVWCVHSPLFMYQNRNNSISNNNVVLCTVQDCIDFLYSESFGHNLLDGIHSLCVGFWNTHEHFYSTESMQSQKDYLGNLYSQCLQLCFKNEVIQCKSKETPIYFENFKLSIETYMQYCLGKSLMYSVNTLQHLADCMVNKIVRNSLDVSLSALNIPQAFNDVISDARYELSRINNVVTVLDKVHCLHQTFNVCSRSKTDQTVYITSEDFLQILVYLIINSNIPNWMANLTYLKEFQFGSFSSPSQTNFLITSLEAAIAFIRSSQFLDVRPSSPIADSFSIIYNQLNCVKSIEQYKAILATEKDLQISKLCHPLCTCSVCQKIHHKSNNSILNSLGQNFLIVATIKNDQRLLQFLLSINFDQDLQDTFGKSALHYAAEKGHQHLIMLLINSECNVNMVDNDCNTPLHLACDKGHDSCVKALIYSSHIVEINLQNISGESPLFIATRWGYLDIITVLLENGASVCLKNNRNMSVFKLASNHYVTKVFREFRQRSKSILEVVKDGVGKLDNDFKNNVCVQSDDFTFGISAKNSAELKRTDLLLKAIENNDMPMVCFYLGYYTDTKESTDEKCHPLCVCSQCSKNDDNLLEISNNTVSKFNVNMCDSDGFTPLHLAVKFGRHEILRILLDCGAMVNVRTYQTLYTPLHLAVKFQRVDAIKELLKSGNCQVDPQDYKGNTPLFYAAIDGNNLKMVELLLQNGANCQKRNYEEKTVLQQCEENNLFTICRMLRETIIGLTDIGFDEELL